MVGNDRDDSRGLPDPGGLNIGYEGSADPEPTAAQLESLRGTLDTIAEGVRRHLTDDFTVTTRITSGQESLQAQFVIEFPTGEAISPTIPITAEMIEAGEGPDSQGSIPREDIETYRQEITTTAVSTWADHLARIGGAQGRPAS